MVELEGGVARSAAGRDRRRAALDAMYSNFAVVPFTADEATIYGQIVERLGFSRTRVIDRMIAATALAAGMKLATLNVRDFRGIPGLVVEDWLS